MKHFLALLLLIGGTFAAAQTLKEAPGYNPRNDNFEEEVWQELRDVEPPAFPVDDTLVEIYVSPVATNKYFIDTTSLTPGKDGVVRYVHGGQDLGGRHQRQLRGNSLRGTQVETLCLRAQ
jgi:hypothetical protein